MVVSQQLMVTSAVFVAALVSFAGLAIKDRKPRTTLDTPLLPTTPLLMISFLVALFAFMALLYLAGIHR
jgi:hypothetical protein